MLTSFNNDRWTVVFLLFAVTISLPSHCQGKANLEWWSRRYVVESKVYGVCVCVCSFVLYYSVWEQKTWSSLRTFVVIFFWATRKGIVVFVGKKKHIHTVFLDEEKEKARGKIVMWVVVQNASFVFIINFFVRRAEWAYSQRSLSVFNSLPTLHTQRRLPAFTFVSYNGEMSCSQKENR
jgi:hypothetical protein